MESGLSEREGVAHAVETRGRQEHGTFRFEWPQCEDRRAAQVHFCTIIVISS